jgi:hypothetical protein
LLDGIPLFNAPRHARRLLTDAIIPLSVAVAKPMPGGKLPHNGTLPWSPTAGEPCTAMI